MRLDKPEVAAYSRPIVPLWLAILLAVAAGLVLDAAFPDVDFWPAIFPGLALALVALVGRRLGTAYLVGFVTALSFYLVDIPWIGKFLGDSFPFPLNQTPLLALSIFEAFFWGAAAMLLALAYRWIPRVFPGFWARILLLPAVIGGLWVLRELVTSNWPWGGFSWGRLAFSQSQSPLASLFPWIGVAGVTFVIAFVTASAIEAVRISSRRTALTAATVVVAAATLGAAFPAFHIPTKGTLRVAAVQGDGPAGYFTPHRTGDLLTAQFNATENIVPGKRKLDVIVWPEGASDLDPETNQDAANIFDFVSRQYNAPLISGTIAERGTLTFNTSLLWEAGKGVVDYYDKRHPVPFGEYVPARSFFEPLAPSLISLIGRDYTPGTNNPILSVKGVDGAVKVGVNICFDIVDDFLMTETVDDGAQIIFAQSNNADFGTTDESVQQLAIARIRARELGRAVVVDSTVGQSEIIAPDGSTLDSVKRYTPAAMVDNVPLATVITPAVVISHPLEWFLAAFGFLALAIGFIGTRRTRTQRAMPRRRRIRA